MADERKSDELDRELIELLNELRVALLIAPSSYHRLRFRAHDKEQLLVTSNRLILFGMAFVAVAMGCSVS